MSERKQLAHEDADEPTVLVVPKPPREWHCDTCCTRNQAGWLSCAYCGRIREDETS